MSEQNRDENIFGEEQTAGQETAPVEESTPVERTPKAPRKVSLVSLVCSCVCVALAAVLLTFSICNSIFSARLAEAKTEEVTKGETVVIGKHYELEMLSKIFELNTFEELDQEALKTAVLKAYVNATGDRYAEYYTKEEYDAIDAEMQGDSQGIGVSVINSKVTYGSAEHQALKVVSVMRDAPAAKSGVRVGDYIVAVGTAEEHTLVSVLGYDGALAKLRGAKGTVANFVVIRDPAQDPLYFEITRDSYTTESVVYGVAEFDEKIGIVRILNFDSTTPSQFEMAMDELISRKCDRFVLDVRNNPGGEVTSVVAVVSYFLEDGDKVISDKSKLGNERVRYAKAVDYSDNRLCDIQQEDIGKYRGLNCVVMCNENTASGGELFTANFRDYKLATVVGTTTFGKGSMQTYRDLSEIGINGVLKMTVSMYYPPCGESYEDIGIEPDVKVELSEEARQNNFHDTMGKAVDNQLTEAIKYFKNS